MPSIILPSRWRQQPQGLVQVRGSFAKGYVWSAASGAISAGRPAKLVVANAPVTAVRGAKAWAFAGTPYSDNISFASVPGITYPWTYLIRLRRRSAQDDARLHTSISGSTEAAISLSVGGSGQLNIIDYGDAWENLGSLTSILPVGEYRTIIVTLDASKVARAYSQGIAYGSAAIASTDFLVLGGNAYVGGSYLGAYGAFCEFDVSEVGLLSGALSDAEAKALSGSLYGELFALRRRVLYFATAGGATVDLEGAAAAQASSAAALDQAVHPAGTASAAASAFAGLAVQIPIVAAAAIAATAAGALALSQPLGGSAGAAAAAQATLTQQVPADDMSGAYGDCPFGACPYGGGTEAYTGVALAGAASAVADGQGGLALSIPLAGAAVAAAVANAAVAQGTPLVGIAAGTAGSAGTINLAVSLSGAALAQAVADAGITVEAPGEVALAGTAAAAATAAGTLAMAIPLTGAAVTVADTAAGLTHIVPLAGASAVALSATGGLDVTAAAVQLAGAALAAAQAGGVITLRVTLSGAGLAQALAAGALTTQPSITAGMLTRVARAHAGPWTARAASGPWLAAAAA